MTASAAPPVLSRLAFYGKPTPLETTTRDEWKRVKCLFENAFSRLRELARGSTQPEARNFEQQRNNSMPADDEYNGFSSNLTGTLLPGHEHSDQDFIWSP